jgi:hypothetical protein
LRMKDHHQQGQEHWLSAIPSLRNLDTLSFRFCMYKGESAKASIAYPWSERSNPPLPTSITATPPRVPVPLSLFYFFDIFTPLLPIVFWYYVTCPCNPSATNSLEYAVADVRAQVTRERQQ